MTSKKRFSTICVSSVCALSLLAGVATVMPNNGVIALAETDTRTYAYYYDNLTTADGNGEQTEYTLAKKFYEALEEIERSGDFRTGSVSYSLASVLTSDRIKAWVVDGNLEIPKAFGAARDSFLMDHPELFYIDMYKLTISASLSGGVYSAYIDSGRAASVYRDNAFSTETAVNKAINDYNAALNKIVDDVNKTVASDKSGKSEDFLAATAANEAIAASVTYDFGAYNDFIENGDGASTASLTHTAYGALVLNKAVCSGYSFAYKAVMDQLDVPCVIVSGYSKGKDKNGNDTAGNVGHAWNYVYLQTPQKEVVDARGISALSSEEDGGWFAFDTTWNSVSSDKNKYSVMDSMTALSQHIANGVISSSEYSLNYPALAALSYEQLCDPNKMDKEIAYGGFSYASTYRLVGGVYDANDHVSYNGYGAKKLLEKENLRFVMRYYAFNNGVGKWTLWTDLANYSDFGASGIFDEQAGTINRVSLASNVHYTQYAVISGVDPDTPVTALNGQVIYDVNCFYSDSENVEKHATFISMSMENQSYGTYTPAPYVISDRSTPSFCADFTISDSMSESSNSNIMSDAKAIKFSIVYTEPLYILDESQPISITFSADHENTRQFAGFAKFDDGQYVHLVKDENGVANTLQFKFKPSLMYEHNREGYAISFHNVGSAKIVEKKIDGQLVTTTSDKVPNHVYYMFSRNYYACSRVFGDGRLWVSCCAQPTLVDNSDLSAMDFKDAEGNSTFSEQERSQMMLVVNKVSPDTENDILNEIHKDKNNNVGKKDIKASQTFDIDLQICGKFASIPDGSYVKIALGFPEGYGPEDEGVTFKIFHRKHLGGNKYIIEEIPCVVTRFGIVATVNSFSPYTVVAVPEKKATSKTVIATVDGKGGKLSNEDGRIQTVEKDGSYTYTVSPDEGYKLYGITLNGNSVIDRVVDGKLTLTYDELSRNNELEMKYISEEAAVRYEANNIVEPVKVIVSTDNTASKYTFVHGEVFPEALSAGAIAGIVIGVIAIVAGGVAIAVVLIIKKKSSSRI